MPLDVWRPKKLLRRKYLYGENEIAAKFHVMWFISLLLLSLLGYPLIYTYLLVVKVLRHILSLTTESYLMNDSQDMILGLPDKYVVKFSEKYQGGWVLRT